MTRTSPSAYSTVSARRPARSALRPAAHDRITLATSPIASACPPAGCGHHEPDNPEPHPPSTPAPIYRVTLKTISALSRRRTGASISSTSCSRGRSSGCSTCSTLTYWNLDVTREVPAPLYVELYDQGLASSDDWLGTAYLNRPATVGASYTETIRLYGSGAVYDLTVKVTRIS